MKKDKNKDNLPIVQNNFKIKLRKAVFILLSSLGIATSIVPTTTYAKEKTDIEKTIDSHDRQNNRDKFLNELKVDVSKNNEKIVDELVKNRGQEYSIATGNGEKVKEILVKTLDKIDENFDRNAKKKGKMVSFTKEEFKKNYISLVSSLDDIVVVSKDTEENQYTEHFKSKVGVTAFYVPSKIKNQKGIIPENIIVMKDNGDDNHLEYTMIHEITHSEQKRAKDNNLSVNYKQIISMLKEGNSNSEAEYIRDINTKSEKNNSLNVYNKPTMIYNKLAFLVGENEMNEFIKNKNKQHLFSFLSDRLDSRYGEGTGESLYGYITNISLYFSTYSGGVTTERIEGLYDEIDKKNKNIQDKIQEKGNNSTLNGFLDANNNFRQMLDRIYKKDKKVRNEELNKQLEGLEKLTLKCINKDIEKINDKNSAIDYVQIWDYYRNRCTINKGFFKGREETLFSDNFKEVKNTQKNLYNKSKQYKALNIKDEKIFNKMIEAQLYNVKNATVSYNKNKTKLIISDEYIVNEFNIEKKKDGSKKYENTNKEHINNKGTVQGTKILSEKRLYKDLEIG